MGRATLHTGPAAAVLDVPEYLNTSGSNFPDVGYVVIPNLLTRAEAHALYEDFSELSLRSSVPDVPGAPSGRRHANERRLVCHERFREPLVRPALTDAVSAALATADWHLLAYEATEIAPQAGKERDWHCDFHYACDDPLVVNVGIYLLDMTQPGGPLLVIPGSQRRGREPNGDEVAARLPGELPLVLPAGSAVVFHGRLWHTASANSRSEPRRSLFAYFGHDWIRRMDDYYRDPLPPAIVDSADPRMRRLFGLRGGSLIHGTTYTPDNQDWQ